jgi:protein-L-isoaspartate(D-aspartate) O-methyltransferase
VDDDDANTRQQRGWMIASQLAARGIRDPRVIEAMGRVPRHAFVAAAMRREAYEDSPLPIEEGQTISQPYIVALMLEAARLGAGDRMLEVGAGSGYASAVAAQLVAHVDAIERHPRLVELARARLARLGITNVDVHAGDGPTTRSSSPRQGRAFPTRCASSSPSAAASSCRSRAATARSVSSSSSGAARANGEKTTSAA